MTKAAKMPEPLHIASAFERLAEIEDGQGLTSMQLLKLLYYSQAISLVETGEVMFDGLFEAWTHGPVEPNVWRYIDRTPDWRQSLMDRQPQLSEETWGRIRAVRNIFGGLDAHALSRATHAERPWAKARDGLSWDQRSSRPISITAIRDFYSELIEDGEDVMAQIGIAPEKDAPWWELPYRIGVNVKRLREHPFFDGHLSREIRKAIGLEDVPDDWSSFTFQPLNISASDLRSA